MPPEAQPGESIVEQFAKGVAEGSPADAPDAGASPSTDGSPEGSPESAPPPATVEPEDKGDVPYARFQEVNGKFRTVEKDFEEYKAGDGKRAEDRAFEIVNGMAENNPALKKALLGETEPAAPAAPAEPLEPGSPEALQAEIAALKKDAADGRAWRENQDRDTALNQVESTVMTEMAKYDGLKGPEFSGLAKEMIGVRLLKDPQAAPEEVVRQVSEEVEGLKKSIRAGYIQGKQANADAIPAGAGGAGGRVVTEAPPNLTLNNGSRSVRNALAAEIAAMNRQEA